MAVFRKVLGLALAATAAVGVSSSASATSFFEFAGTGGGFFGASSIDVGAFTHTFFLSPRLSFGDGSFSGQVNTATSGTTAIQITATDFDFSGATGFRLYDATANTYVNALFTTPAPGAENEWILNATVLSGHLYSLIVNGTSKGASSSIGGSYTYSASVPEAGTWMMMVAGFGLMGAAMRRRPRTQVTFA